MSGRPRNGKIGAALGGHTAEPVLFLDNVPTGSIPSFELLTPAEVARMLKVSVSGIRRLQQHRRLPFIKVGGCIRFAKSDIAAYLEKCRVGPIG